MVQKEHFNLRLNSDTLQRLVRQSELTGQPKSTLAARFLEEGLRMAEHPGIVFRDGAAGRRPGLAGHRLDVWEVIETVLNEGGDARAASAYLSVTPSAVATAVDYYVDYKDEVDHWIQRNWSMAEDAEAAWLRRQESGLTA